MKIENDKYYTPENLAKKLIYITLHVLKHEHITDVIEPSAGNGSFSHNIKCTAYDIEPESDDIIKADFLKLNLKYKKGRLFIGNPPFGNRNHGSQHFYKKCCKLGDYIAFIQPISQLNNDINLYEFDLIYSIDIGKIKYTDRIIHCCFNIYRIPKNGVLHDKRLYDLNDVTLIEYRRIKGNYHTGRQKEILPNWDYSFCSWGNGSIGKIPEYIGQYACEIYVYIHNKIFKDDILNICKNIKNIVKTSSSKRIGCQRLYKYFIDNIEGIK